MILVDNSALSTIDLRTLPVGCELIALGANTGIAHAQNAGIRRAVEQGADVVALFDQDSQIPDGFLTALTAPLRSGAARVVAPLFFDDAGGFEFPSMRLNGFGWPRPVYHTTGGVPYPVDVVISSGTAVAVSVFEVVGGLDDDLFIDLVDTDWCLRCRSMKIPIHVVPAAVMRHRIGSRSIDLGITTVLVHGPERCYYQIRNSFLLSRKAYVPRLFALREIVVALVSRLLLLPFVRGRWAYVRAYSSAVRDGLAGAVGKKRA